MNAALCLTIRFLDPLPHFHGRGADGDPEWPPSPLRLFQALLSASANTWRDGQFGEIASPALQWLEKLTPIVAAPKVPSESFGFRMYVPNNSGDLMTAAWARGDTETSMAKFRVEKDVRPTHLAGDAVHYIYALDEPCPHFDVLQQAARSITHLGWGIDMVAGDASLLSAEEVAELEGEVWRPTRDGGGTALRVPKVGTLDALMTKHQAFLNRLSSDGFKPVPPLAVFDVVHYRRATEPAAKPFVAFQILDAQGEKVRAFDTARRCRDVAGYARHATKIVCAGWPFGDVSGFVHGHDGPDEQLKGPNADARFMYLPIPTVNSALNRVESIRRVLIAAPPGFEDRIAWIRRRLPGQELTWDGKAIGLLTLLPTSDWVLKRYTKSARTWSTVTPVVLPGHDDPDGLRRKLRERPNPELQKHLLARLDRRALQLIQKSFCQAGWSEELMKLAEIDYRNVGFRAGVDLAHRYAKPDHMNGRMYHVRVRFPHPVPGPLAVGAGRYRGFGLFAAED